MKSRVFKIIIAAEFDEEQDVALVSEVIMRSLQHPGVPTGRCQVLAIPMTLEQVQKLPQEVLDRLN